MDKRQCVSCGAPIKHGALKCEYCGMTYDPGYWDNTVRYIPLRMRSKRLRVRDAVDVHLLTSDDNRHVASAIKRHLTVQLADALSEIMATRLTHDPISQALIVEGEIWVEEPDKRTAFPEW